MKRRLFKGEAQREACKRQAKAKDERRRMPFRIGMMGRNLSYALSDPHKNRSLKNRVVKL